MDVLASTGYNKNSDPTPPRQSTSEASSDRLYHQQIGRPMPIQYRAVWTVPGGGTGYSVFNVRQGGASTAENAAQNAADDIRAFFSSLAVYLPNEITISFEAEALELNTTTGTLEAVIPVTSPASVTGSSAAVWAGGVGGRVNWATEAVVAGHRLAGRTFLVPLSSGVYENNGTLTSAFITAATAAGNALIAAGGADYALAVWSRTHGVLADASEANVQDKTAILRGRRDE